MARAWKQPRCSSTEEWVMKLWCIYTMAYFSAIKRNTFGSVLMRWMNLEPIIHSEVSQKEKDKYCILSHIWDRWMASLTRWTWVWVGDGDGQGGLACCNSWGRKESDTTEWLNWTEQMTYIWNLEKWHWRIYLQGNSGETDIENRRMDMGREEERVRCLERVTWKLTLLCVK